MLSVILNFREFDCSIIGGKVAIGREELYMAGVGKKMMVWEHKRPKRKEFSLVFSYFL